MVNALEMNSLEIVLGKMLGYLVTQCIMDSLPSSLSMLAYMLVTSRENRVSETIMFL